MIKKNRQKQESFLFILMGMILLGLIVSGYFLFVDKILPGISAPKGRSTVSPGEQPGRSYSGGGETSAQPIPDAISDSENQVITLYFLSRRSRQLLREIRRVPAEKLLLSQAESLIRELLRGPLTPDARACIPPGTQLRSIFFNQGVFYVDFTREFTENQPGGVLEEVFSTYSIVNTLTELDRKAKVKILVNGIEISTLKGHIGLDTMLTRCEPLISTQ